jgi:signal transduction histidine kinase
MPGGQRQAPPVVHPAVRLAVGETGDVGTPPAGQPPDFRLLFESLPEKYLVIDPNLVIVAASDAYLTATLTQRESMVGRRLFDVFPDNPDDPATEGARNLKASLTRVVRERTRDSMSVQRFDIPRPASAGGGFEERFWTVSNSPVLAADDSLAAIVHAVEDVTEYMRRQLDDPTPFFRPELRARADNLIKVRQAERNLRALHMAEERERIARDLHDLVIQRVFGAGMRVNSMLPAAQGAMAEKLREVVSELDSVISDIRTTIFDLQTDAGVRSGLRSGVRDLAADAAERLGFQPRVRFAGPVDTVVDRGCREQLLAVLRESLSNVIRHAAATAVEVEVTATDELVLRVSDDGRGASSDWGEGFGLRNMASRAAELRGSFALGINTPRGTILQWRVPLGGAPARI